MGQRKDSNKFRREMVKLAQKGNALLLVKNPFRETAVRTGSTRDETTAAITNWQPSH